MYLEGRGMSDETWEDLMARRGDQIAKATNDAKAARHQSKNDRNSGKDSTKADQARGEALTRAADLKAAAKAAGERGYR
jgi:hypothetical protein